MIVMGVHLNGSMNKKLIRPVLLNFIGETQKCETPGWVNGVPSYLRSKPGVFLN